MLEIMTLNKVIQIEEAEEEMLIEAFRKINKEIVELKHVEEFILGLEGEIKEAEQLAKEIIDKKVSQKDNDNIHKLRLRNYQIKKKLQRLKEVLQSKNLSPHIIQLIQRCEEFEETAAYISTHFLQTHGTVYRI